MRAPTSTLEVALDSEGAVGCWSSTRALGALEEKDWSSWVTPSTSMPCKMWGPRVGRRAMTVKEMSCWFCSNRRRRLGSPRHTLRSCSKNFMKRHTCLGRPAPEGGTHEHPLAAARHTDRRGTRRRHTPPPWRNRAAAHESSFRGHETCRRGGCMQARRVRVLGVAARTATRGVLDVRSTPAH